MKKILSLLICALVFTQCQKNETSFSPLEELINDPVLKAYQDANYHLSKQIPDLKKFRSYIADRKIDAKEATDVHIVFGFTSRRAFDEYYSMVNKNLNYFNATYDIKNVPKEKLRSALTIDRSGGSYTCAARNRCKRGAATLATIEHFGCAMLDAGVFTTFLGVLCHAAVISLMIDNFEECNETHSCP